MHTREPLFDKLSIERAEKVAKLADAEHTEKNKVGDSNN
jgi:hypothetical protein